MVSQSPFFSIVIPTLNEEKYLPHLLESLSEQGFRDFEVIVVDAHSGDKTLARAAEYATKLPKLTLLNSPVRNVSRQRNQGGRRSAGKYIIFVDADSYLSNYFLSGLHYRLESKKTDFFTCWCYSDTPDAISETTVNILNIFVETAFLLDSPVAMGSLIGIKRTVFQKTKGFDPKVPFAEDSEYANRVFKLGYTFRVFRDPRFIFSMRRFKRTGTLKVFRQYANLHLKRLVGLKIDQEKEYPMGGETAIIDKPTQTLLEAVIKTFDAGRKIPRIVTKIKAIFTLSEEE